MESKTVRLVCLGDGAVGKTSLVEVFAKNRFPDQYTPNIYDFYQTQRNIDNVLFNIALHDTAGQDEYEQVRQYAYGQADVLLICFSLIDKNTLTNVFEKWREEVNKYCPNLPFILVGTKLDLRNMTAERTTDFVTSEEGHSMQMQVGARLYCECSALSRDGLENVFQHAVRLAHDPNYGKKKKKKTLCFFL